MTGKNSRDKLAKFRFLIKPYNASNVLRLFNDSFQLPLLMVVSSIVLSKVIPNFRAQTTITRGLSVYDSIGGGNFLIYRFIR